MEGEDIHRRHRKASTIDEAANASVEFDEVEIGLLRFNFRGFLLCNIAQSEDVFLAECSIIIETKLGIHAITTTR